MSAADKLQAAIEKYKQRSSQYGDVFTQVGQIAAILLPSGAACKYSHDHARMQLLLQVIAKLCRYTSHFESGGHQDSLHDLIVYAAMLEAMDEKEDAPCI